MEIKEYVNSEYSKSLDTEGLRSNFLIRDIFLPNWITMTYSYVDRMIAGGITPKAEKLALAATRELGTTYFLERREMGIINIGGPGAITVDGVKHAVGPRDGFYISMGSKEVALLERTIPPIRQNTISTAPLPIGLVPQGSSPSPRRSMWKWEAPPTATSASSINTYIRPSSKPASSSWA